MKKYKKGSKKLPARRDNNILPLFKRIFPNGDKMLPCTPLERKIHICYRRETINERITFMDDEEDDLIPSGRKETGLLVLTHLRKNAKWAEIYPYVLHRGYLPQTEEDEQKSKRALVDQDTMVMAMLVYLNYAFDESAHTVSSLAKAMDNSSYNARKAVERWISRTLVSIAGYQIIDFYKDQHIGERNCIRIEPTDLLINFFESYFFNTLGERQ